jgi:hypothetical protein
MAAGKGELAEACTKAWYTPMPIAKASVPWRAPVAAPGAPPCVSVSVAQAADSSDHYHTNTVRALCSKGTVSYRTHVNCPSSCCIAETASAFGLLLPMHYVALHLLRLAP